MEIQGEQMMNQLLGNIAEYLSRQDANAEQLMRRPQFCNQIRQQPKQFAKFCQRKQQQCYKVINKAFLTNQFSSQEQKQICSKCNEIMCLANPHIISIFVGQTTKVDQLQKLNQCENRQKYEQKYKFLIYLLQYLNLDKCKINLTSISQIIKLLNNIIQNNVIDICILLKIKPKILELFVDLAGYFAGISDMLTKIILDNGTGFRQLKQQIIESMIVNMKNCEIINTSPYIFLLDFVQTLLNRNRYRNQDNQELIIVTQRLVDEDVIEFFILKVLQLSNKSLQNKSAQNELTLYNSLQYLLLLANRISGDQESIVANYSQNQQKQRPEPSMDFQINSITKNYQKLLTTTPSHTYQNIVRLSYYQFLIKISENRYLRSLNFDACQTVIFLLKSFKTQSNNGLIKIYITQLIQICVNKIQKISSTEALKIASALGPVQNLLKNVQCQALIIKIGIILAKKNQVFIKHYKSLQLNQVISKYVDIVGSQLSFIQNKKFKCKQLQFLTKDRLVALKQAIERANQSEQSSDIDQEFQSCFPRTPASNRYSVQWTENNDFFINNGESSNSQVSNQDENEDEDEDEDEDAHQDEDEDEQNNGILLIQSANLDQQIKRVKQTQN